LRAESFSCSLDVLYGGLGIRKLQFLIRKKNNLSAVFLFLFLAIKTLDSEPDSLEMLDPDPYRDPDSMNPDPTCLHYNKFRESVNPDSKPMMG
jgi:hypothetical protein